MTLLDRLFRPAAAPREALRPLWHAIVLLAREPRLYRDLGVADTVAGRFDMIALVLALVLLRLEAEPEGAEPAARLTELFVEDMDAQLRQTGVGDLVVGKNMGKLVATLGGRLGALREALSGDGDLSAAIARNVTLEPGAGPQPLADAVRDLHRALGERPRDAILAGRLAA